MPCERQAAWMKRLKIRINELRGEIVRLTQYKRNVQPQKLFKHVKKIIKPVEKHDMNDDTLTDEIDKLSQKHSAYAKGLRRDKECIKRKQQSKEFQNNEEQF